MPGGAVGEDDAANWRRTQSRRKQRGLSFLQNKHSGFQLLATLAMATTLSPLTYLCFRLVNSDKQGIDLQPSRRATGRVRRRMRAKGSEAESFQAIFDGAHNLHFDQVRVQAKRCAERLWLELQGSLQSFICADCFWPAAEPAHAKLASLAENVLCTLAGLKWRILQKFDFPPWSLAPLSVPGHSRETVPW